MESTDAMAGGILAVEELSDEEVVRRVRDGDVELFADLIRRYDQRVYRCARAVLADDAEAEDVTQEAWVRAYQHLDQFAGRARFSTWLTRIALHEAFARSRHGRKVRSLDEDPRQREELLMTDPDSPTPESETLGRELRLLLEEAIEALPETYRIVFMLREVIGIDDFQASRAPDRRYRTSPLGGLWTHAKGGFYHDGRFASLLDVVNHYDTSFNLGLAAEEKSQLVEYLKSLPSPE